MSQPSYDDELPVRWQPLSAEDLSPRALQRLQEDNTRLLRLFTLLDDPAAEPLAIDEPNREQHQLQALDVKLNLALELLVDLLCDADGSDRATPIRLTTDTLSWSEPGSLPEQGGRVIASLMLRPGFPKALRFPGTVTEVEPAERRVTVTFQGLGEAFRDVLTRFIFRHHRRAIHERRSD